MRFLSCERSPFSAFLRSLLTSSVRQDAPGLTSNFYVTVEEEEEEEEEEEDFY